MVEHRQVVIAGCGCPTDVEWTDVSAAGYSSLATMVSYGAADELYS